MLTAYDGKSITYDAIGNPNVWHNGTGDWNLTWDNGRQLTEANKGSHYISYTYDLAGIRDSKTVDGVTYNYITQNGQVVRQNWGDHVMDFIYDNSGKPYALKYDGTTYYYVLNLQGDVISIITHWGETYGSYTYDAWGNVLSVSGDIAYLNPIRYRGYYYDSETRLYYLGSRYYDPQVKRFVNADGATLAVTNSGELTDKNYFAYCNNSPVMQKDDGGELGHIAIGAIVGGILGAAGEVVSQVATGTKLKDVNWKDVAIEGVNGAMTGGLLAAGLPTSTVTTGRALINAATAVAHGINNGKTVRENVIAAGGAALATRIIGGFTKPNGLNKVITNRLIRTAGRSGSHLYSRYKGSLNRWKNSIKSYVIRQFKRRIAYAR